MANYSAIELSTLFEKNGLPYAPITQPEDLFDDPHLKATGGLAALTLPDGKTTHAPLIPITLNGERPTLRLNPPQLGEHTEILLAELGYTNSQISIMQYGQKEGRKE